MEEEVSTAHPHDTIPPSPSFWRQVRAVVRKNKHVLLRSRTTCFALAGVPVVLSLVLLMLARFTRTMGAVLDGTTSDAGVERFAPAAVPALGSTQLLRACVLAGRPCMLAVAPDTPAVRALGERVADALYDSDAGRTTPLEFCADRADLEARLSANASDYFAGLVFADDGAAVSGHYDMYVDGAFVPAADAYASPVTVETAAAARNASQYLTAGIATLQRAVHVARAGPASARAAAVETLQLPAWRFAALGGSVAVLAAVLHATMFSGAALVRLVGERTSKTREYLLVLGLRRSAYWLGWVLTLLAYVAYVDVLSLAALVAAGAVVPRMLPVLALVMASFSVCLVVAYLAIAALFSNTVVLSSASVLWMVLPVMLGYFLPISNAVQGISTVIFAPLGYFLAVAQCICASLGSLPVTHIPPAGFVALFALNALLTGILAWYLTRVLPGAYGAAEHPLFLFRRPFWNTVFAHVRTVFPRSDYALVGQHVPETDDALFQDAVDEGTAASEHGEENGSDGGVDSSLFEAQDERNADVRVEDIRKVFTVRGQEPVVAVAGVRAAFCRGRVTTLLGENGAGKSTLIATLCGLQAPTSGDAVVGGHRVCSSLASARRVLGICPQDDVLFPAMTAAEHVRLVSDIRGVVVPQDTSYDAYVRDLLGSCGVDEAEHHGCRVEAMSGGMRRKLSLALALVGSPRVLLLDEPTSGVDAVARRSIWSMLGNLKNDRTVILTTHSMDEADALSDHIYLMHEGRMVAGGSPAFLKHRCGAGAFLTVDLVEGGGIDVSDRHASVQELVAGAIPGAALHDEAPATLVFRLPSDQIHAYGALFHRLEDDDVRKELGVRTYGVSHSSLNDVFVRMCSPHAKTSQGASDNESKENSTKDFNKIDDRMFMGRASSWKQFVSVVYAKMLYFVRNRSVLMSMVLLPVIQCTLFACVFLLISSSSSNEGSPTSNIAATVYKQHYLPCVVNTTDSYDNATAVRLATCIGTELNTKPRWYRDVTALENDVISSSGYAYGLVIQHAASADNVSLAIMYNSSFSHTLPIALDVAYRCLGVSPTNASTSTSIGTLHALSSDTEVVDKIGFDILGMALTICCVFALVCESMRPIEQLVAEREKGSKQLLLVAGCRPRVYVFASIIANSFALLIPMLVVFAAVILLRLVSAGAVALILLSSVLFCFAGSAFNYCVSLRFRSGKSAATFLSLVLMWIIAVPTIIYTILSIFLIAGPQLFTSGEEFFLRMVQFILEFVPHFACLNSVASVLLVPADYPLVLVASWKSRYVLDVIALIASFIAFTLMALSREYRADAVPTAPSRTAAPALAPDPDVRAEYDRVAATPESTDAFRVRRLGKVFLPSSNARGFLSSCVSCCTSCTTGRNNDATRKRVDAVRDVSFGVPANECFGLLGPNGSGKTTLMAVATAQLDATYGTVAIRGTSLAGSRQHYYDRTRLALCPQDGGQLGYLTAREHLSLLLSQRGSNGTRAGDTPQEVATAAIDTTLAALGFGENADRPSQTLSGGYQRRLSVAAALLPGSRVLVLDEPSTGMDVVSQRTLWHAVRARRARPDTAVLLTTHSMEEAEAVCSRIGVLLHGSLEAFGTLQHLRDRHSSGLLATIAVRPNTEDVTLVARLRTELAAVAENIADTHTAHTPTASRISFRLLGVPSIAALYDALENCRTQFPDVVLHYTVTQASLESIFVEMVQRHEAEDSDDGISP